MKKSVLLFSIVLTAAFIACGGDSPQPEKNKKFKKSTQEGAMQIMNNCNINLPEELKFVEVVKKSAEFTATFDAQNPDAKMVNKLNAWYAETVKKLTDDKWRKMVIRNNEKMMGIIVNDTILYPPLTKHIKGISSGVEISTANDTKKKTFKFYFKY